ncbi:MAG: hypothetical protein PHF50_01365 [Patescibacteria group bacterium]|nr:hypothetical protein [Patescibacteria group bacterium]
MIIKKNYLLILGLFILVAVFLGVNYDKLALALSVTDDPVESIINKDACYNNNTSSTLTKTVYNKKDGLKPLFSFYGVDANTADFPYGKAGTIVAAGNVAAGGGKINFGTINNGTSAQINSSGELDFYVNNNKVITFSNQAGYGVRAAKGIEIKGNLKTEKIIFRGKEVKSASINGQNILYTEF